MTEETSASSDGYMWHVIHTAHVACALCLVVRTNRVSIGIASESDRSSQSPGSSLGLRPAVELLTSSCYLDVHLCILSLILLTIVSTYFAFLVVA